MLYKQRAKPVDGIAACHNRLDFAGDGVEPLACDGNSELLNHCAVSTGRYINMIRRALTVLLAAFFINPPCSVLDSRQV